MVPSNQVRLDVLRLWDETVAQKYKGELAESFCEYNDFGNLEKS